ncbi:hypothetical protein Lser_V15G03252 [Lactuca serriola]
MNKCRSKVKKIGYGGYGIVYIGQLTIWSEERSVAIKCLNKHGHQGSDEFYKELEMVPTFNHPNIISFIGYCEEAGEMIIVYEYAANGSLDRHIQITSKRRHLSWGQRLKICLGAAKGLDYLHSAIDDDRRVIHRDVKSGNILLDDNLEAKISDFGLSRYGPVNQKETKLVTPAAGTNYYMDPVYGQRGRLSKESDVYSFGVVLFEMSSGMMCYNRKCFGNAKDQYLLDLVRCYYDEQEDDGLNKLIDPIIKGQIDMASFHMFNEIAHECINLDVTKRPTMKRIIDRIQEALNIQSPQYQTTSSDVHLENYLIPLKEIKLATENFSLNRCIGSGGFSDVYRGQLSERWQKHTAAIKRLKFQNYQRNNEFLKDFELIAGFHHKNIISLIGYCDEGNENILVYEYARYGSLDHYIHDSNKMRCMTWTQRLQICIGAARGLNHLHSGLGDHKRVIHGDVKSDNILLDGNLVAKICDFGFSKLRHRYQQHTYLMTNVAGNQLFYLDPVYLESGILGKESDVYSLGLVLFEILSGMLVYSQKGFEDDKPQMLMNSVRRYSQKPERLIDPHIRDQIDNRSFDTFNEIAYQCISFKLKERPTMDKVVERIEEALDIQMEENVAVLCECIRVEVGFSYGKPVAAYTIYKCLLHWKTLEDERTPVFDKLIHIILSAIEDGDNNNQMAYWISNASTLLFLIQETIRKRPPQSWPYGRFSVGSRSSVSSGETVEIEDDVQEVEAKYPTLLFKKRLIACLNKMYDVIHSNLKKQLGSLLALCIQAPPRSEGMGISRCSFGKDPHINPWQGIVDCLNNLLNTLKENFVPQKIVQKIFTQTFSYINLKIFNIFFYAGRVVPSKMGNT